LLVHESSGGALRSMLATCLRRAARTLLAPPAHLLPGSGALFSVQIVVPALGDSISDGAGHAAMVARMHAPRHPYCNASHVARTALRMHPTCCMSTRTHAGTIASVLKKSGDAVSENETIAQIETDKVTIDIKAPADGTLLGVVVQEQDTVVPGQLVATLDDAAAKVRAGHASAAVCAGSCGGAGVGPHNPDHGGGANQLPCDAAHVCLCLLGCRRSLWARRHLHSQQQTQHEPPTHTKQQQQPQQQQHGQ
jgi:biotin carboxyl carrier protein